MISIIVPVLNEQKNIDNLLTQIQKLKGEKEIIVVDGGSSDRTVEIASKKAKVIQTQKNRSLQMNTGAKYATGKILWFLHADSKLDQYSLFAIKKCIDDGNIAGGFSIHFYDCNFGWKNIFMKLIATTSSLRVKLLKVVFGDQGFFIKKSIFNKIEGFKKMPLMEDYEISKRIRKLGRVKLLKNKIGTSARRFSKNGILKTFLQMKRLQLRFLVNRNVNDLSKKYEDIR